MEFEKCLLYVGTEDGVRVLSVDPKHTVQLAAAGLQGNAVRAIAVHPENPDIAYIGCGLRGWGLYMTRDSGQSFTDLNFMDRWVWDVVLHPSNPQTIWVGTEPPMIYISHDSGNSFQAIDHLANLPHRKKWHFFHAPFYAGHIHGITFDQTDSKRIYAGIEQGGLIYTHDGGQSWYEALIGYDLHRIGVSLADPNYILAGAGEGLFASKDAGKIWESIPSLQGKYIHSIVSSPDNHKRWYVYADDKLCPIYRSDDNGETWQSIGKGLPSAQPADNLVIHPITPNVLFYVGDTQFRKSALFLSTDSGENWKCILEDLPKVWRVRIAAD